MANPTTTNLYQRALQQALLDNVEHQQRQQQTTKRAKGLINEGFSQYADYAAKARFAALQNQAVNNPATYQQTYPTAGNPMAASSATTATGAGAGEVAGATASAVGPTVASSMGTGITAAVSPGVSSSIVGTASGQAIANATMPAATAGSTAAAGTTAGTTTTSAGMSSSGYGAILAAYLMINSAQPGSALFPVRKYMRQATGVGDDYIAQPIARALDGKPGGFLSQVGTHFSDPGRQFTDAIFGNPNQQEAEAKRRQGLVNMQKAFGVLRRQAGTNAADLIAGYEIDDEE